MSHLKRRTIERSWPLPRKGTKYLLKAYPGKKKELSIPLGLLIKNILNLAKTRKEVKALLHGKEISVDGKIITEEKFPISIFDSIGLAKLGKYYRVILNESGKIALEDIHEKESTQKICKVIGKKILNKGIKQVNCFGGRNFISKEKISMNDSVIVDLKTNNISKIMPLKIGSEIFIIGGEHIGEKGKISELDKNIKVNIKNKNFEINAKNIIVIS